VCTFLAWLRYQWSSSSPLVDLRTLRLPEIRLGNAATVANACAAFGLFLAVPQLLQSSPDEAGYGLSPIGVGAVLAPAAAVMAIVGPLAGWMGSRVGHHVPAVIGNLVCAGGLGAMTFWHGSMSAVLAWFIVSAVGLGLTFPALPSLVMGAVPQSDAGAAAGLNSLSRGIGSAVGAQIAAALLFVQVASSPGAAFPRTFMASALFALVAAAFVAAVPRRRRV
jgi:MFS family permease